MQKASCPQLGHPETTRPPDAHTIALTTARVGGIPLRPQEGRNLLKSLAVSKTRRPLGEVPMASCPHFLLLQATAQSGPSPGTAVPVDGASGHDRGSISPCPTPAPKACSPPTRPAAGGALGCICPNLRARARRAPGRPHRRDWPRTAQLLLPRVPSTDPRWSGRLPAPGL